MWDFFPSRGPPSLSPHFWNPMFVRNFGFHKNVTFWVVLWLVEVGMDGPPPLREKFPLYPVFPFFLQNELSGTQNKIS